MTVFLDTSALFKLYHKELFSQRLYEYLQGSALVISELSRIEFATTTWKKVRSPRELAFDSARATVLQQRFLEDLSAQRLPK